MATLLRGWPTVSVVIPVYDASDCIATAVASVFAQTRSDHELVLVDDGSHDADRLHAEIARWRSDIRLERQANAGAGAARNRGVAFSRGQYVAFLDADDEWAPDFLERQLDLLQSRVSPDLVWSDGWIRGSTALGGQRYFEATGSVDPPSFQSLVKQTCTVLTSSVLARRAAIEAVYGFDARIRRGQDWDLWLRLAHKGIVMEVNPSPLVWRAVRASNLSGDSISELRRAIAVLQGIPRKLPLDTLELGLVHDRLVRLESQLGVELGKRALRAGDFASARWHFDRSRAAGTWKVRCAAIAMRIAPGLLRGAYLRSVSAAAPQP